LKTRNWQCAAALADFKLPKNLAMSQLSVDLLRTRTWRKLFVKSFLQTSFKNFNYLIYLVLLKTII